MKMVQMRLFHARLFHKAGKSIGGSAGSHFSYTIAKEDLKYNGSSIMRFNFLKNYNGFSYSI